MVLVQIACPSEEEALSLSRSLLEDELVAACQIVKIFSLYFWQGKKEERDEWRIDALSREDLLLLIHEKVEAEHSYNLPEVISLPISGISDAYAAWISESTQKGSQLRRENEEDTAEV